MIKMSLKAQYKDKSNSDVFDVNSKYLHKKFKKMAETVPVREKLGVQDDAAAAKEVLPEIGDKEINCTSVNGQSRIGGVHNELDVSPIGVRTHDGKIASSGGINVADDVDAASRHQNVCVQCKFESANYSVPHKCTHAHARELPYPSSPSRLPVRDGVYLNVPRGSQDHAVVNQKERGASVHILSAFENKASKHNGGQPSAAYSSHRDGSRETLPPSTLHETNNNQECPKQIYKPKFKATLQYEEGEVEHASEVKSSTCRPLNRTIVTSPLLSLDSVTSISYGSSSLVGSEHSPHRITKPENVEVIVDGNDSVITENFYRGSQRDLSVGQHSSYISIASHFVKPHLPLSTSTLVPTSGDQLHRLPLHSVPQRSSQAKLSVAFGPLDVDAVSLHSAQPLNLSAPSSAYEKIEAAPSSVDAFHRKRSHAEELPVAFNYEYKKTVAHGNASVAALEKVEKAHLYNGESGKLLSSLKNPERFTIKDLLLKTGGKVQAVGVMQGNLKDVVPIGEIISDSSDALVADFSAASPNKLQCYICAVCKCAFETAAYLTIHQQLYCRQKQLLYSGDVRNVHHSLNRDTVNSYSSLGSVPATLSKDAQTLVMRVGNTAVTSSSASSLSSPGPILGNTLLVAKSGRLKQAEGILEELEEKHHTAVTLSKRRRLDSDLPTSQMVRSMGPILTVTDISDSISSLRNLEESPKFPAHQNRRMFGEVQILGGAGKTMSLLGNTLAKPLGCAADMIHRLPSHIRPNSFPISSSTANEIGEDVSRHVIVSSESHSDSAVVRVAHESLGSTSTNLSPGSVIKSLHVPGGSVAVGVHQRSKSSSPVRKPSQNAVGSGVSNTPPPPFSYSSATLLSPGAALTMNSPNSVAKHLVPSLPSISLPNLPTAKIPVRTLGHQLPYMPFLLGLSDFAVVGSLNPTVGSNTQPAQEAASCNKIPGSIVQQDSSGALTIVHKGKSIPYVPGMPGPQSLTLSSPVQTPGREEFFSEPLDLAFPPKDDGVQYFSPKRSKLDDVSNSRSNPNIEETPALYQTERYVESNAAAENKTYVSSEQKATAQVKPLARVEPRVLSSVAAGTESKRAVLSLPSLAQGTSVIQTSDSGKSVLYDPATPTHKSCKASKPVKYQPVFQSGGSDGVKEDNASRQDASREEKLRESKTESGSSDKNAAVAVKFHRPNSLPLKPETFVPRKHFQFGSTPGGSVVLQVSPETPRSRKSFGQLYLQGNVFTFLNLKISTRPFFCILTRTQPMYVVQTPENPKLSMYSNWRIKRTACPNPLGLGTTEALAFYDSRNRCNTFTTAKPKDKEKMIYTHSSYWLSREHSRTERNRASRPDWEKSSNGNKRREEHVKTAEPEASSGEPPPRKAKIFGRGFESKEDYTYVKGRGRGRYVCNDCGIRCLKPSMLRNHIRTHTNIRPYICRHCNFSFKTKGNLTKHMKSKAHYKKCIKLCIFPVPTVVDDSYIDEECFAQQAAQQGESGDTDSDENEEDEDEDDDDKESEEVSNDYLEQEVAHSLLSLSEPVLPYSTPPSSGLAPASSYTGRPSTYPYMLTVQQAGTSGGASSGVLQSPGLTPVCAQMERETVLRNTSLAVELGGRRADRRKDERHEMSTMVYRRDDAAPFTHIPRLQSEVSKYHCAGGRVITPFDGKYSVDGRSMTDKGSDADDEYGSSISCSEDDSETSGRKEKQNLDIDAYSSASVPQPIDLSTKNPSCVLPHPRVTLSSASFPVTSPFVTRMHSASAAEIFAPFPGPAAIVASPNGSMDHGQFQGSMFDIQLQASADSSEMNILHKYLTKREAQNTKLYQHDDSMPMETSVVPRLPRTSPMTAADSVSGEHQPKETDLAHRFRPGTKHSSENVVGEDPADTDASFGKLQTAQEGARGSVDASAAPTQSQCSEKADGTGSSDLEKQKTKSADDAATEVPSSNCDNAAKNAMISRLGFSGHSWVPSLPAVSNAAEPEAKAEFLPPSSRPLPAYVRVMKDGQSMCIICNKVFSKPSQLRLHVNIHCLEHPFKCELCAVSFRKKGHLKKHETSVSHQNRVGTTAAVCTLTTTNPRPFKCDDCNIAFRIHGHLAKHLRSKMHIMKLECIGKLPFGTYEEMEREGFDPYDIDTTDCENSLESLQVLAQRLHRKDPSKLGHWGGGEADSFHPNCPSPATAAQRARDAGGCTQAAEAGAGDCCSGPQDPGDAGRRAATVPEFSVPSSPACHAPHM